MVGHKAILHGCQIDDGCLVGMNATVLNGAQIGEGSMVAAGAVDPEGREIPHRSLLVGLLAKKCVEDVGEEQPRSIARGAQE